MYYIFGGCSKVNKLPDISKWSPNNATEISCLFSGCKLLTSVPDIINLNLSKVKVFVLYFQVVVH